MSLFSPFRRTTVERDAAFEQAFSEGAVRGVPGRCAHCGRRILNPSNMARHVRAKHPEAAGTGLNRVVGETAAAPSAPDTLGDSIAA